MSERGRRAMLGSYNWQREPATLTALYVSLPLH